MLLLSFLYRPLDPLVVAPLPSDRGLENPTPKGGHPGRCRLTRDVAVIYRQHNTLGGIGALAGRITHACVCWGGLCEVFGSEKQMIESRWLLPGEKTEV